MRIYSIMYRDLSASRVTGVMLVMVCVAALLAFGLGLSSAGATTYYADAARPDDSGAGTSWATAKKTIQAAIDGSSPGDTILVKHGLYEIAVACSLKTDRMMTSDDGTHYSWDTATPDSSLCIISSAGTSRVLTIEESAITSATRLRGFKVTGGIATNEGDDPNNPYGGGILIADGADAIIENCWITNNTAGTAWNGYGGGVACTGEDTEPTIKHCNISYNIATTAWNADGGGIFCGDGAFVQIYQNTITNNTASTNRSGAGGGICCFDADAWIWSNTVSNNTASGSDGVGGSGGGIYISAGAVEVWDNVVTNNTAAVHNSNQGVGGGIWCQSTNALIRDNPEISYNVASVAGPGYGGGLHINGATVSGNVITHNTASTSGSSIDNFRIGRGGGIYAPGNNNLITGNVISGNVGSILGEGRGGAIYFDTSATIERNIISFNAASDTTNGSGGGTYSYNASASALVNNTFFRNANRTGIDGSGGNGSAVCHASGGLPVVANNVFMSHDVANSDSLAVYFGVAVTITNNCFHNNPGGNYNPNVTSLNEPGTDPRFTDPDNGDFTLMYDSPCIEAGNSTYPCPEDGGWIVDIGAIEYTGTRHKRLIPGVGEYLFGGQIRAKVNVTTLGTLGDIDMTVYPGELHPMAATGVMRWYDIDATGGGATFDLTLSYADNELLLVDETDLWVWRWTGSAWEGPKVLSASSLADNWVAVSGQTTFSDWVITAAWGPVGVGDGHDIPGRAELFATYPNPFNPTTNITYSLTRPSQVILAVYDAAGHEIRVLVDGRQEADYYRTTWNGLDEAGTPVASGVYFLRLEAGNFSQVRKIVLVR